MKRIYLAIFLIIGGNLFAQADLPDLAKIKIAAEAGDAAAQDKLAEQYQGRGDTAKAIFWYRKSAVQNFVRAQSKLGNMLFMRYEMHLDLKSETRAALGAEAVKWISLAANQDNKQAETDFAQIYFNGSLVKQDFIEAYKWGELASHGSPLEPPSSMGKSIRDAAILKLDTAQIKEAQKRVNSFVPQPATAPPVKKAT